MGYVITDSANLTAIADKVRGLKGKSELMSPTELISDIQSLSIPKKGIKIITTNGVITGAEYNGVSETYGILNSEKNITNISIPGSVKTISYCAFVDCANLASVTLAEGVETLMEDCFKSTKIAEIRLPSSIKTIKRSFYNIPSLTKVWIPKECQTIDAASFYFCNKCVIYTDAEADRPGWATNWANKGPTSTGTVYYGSTIEDYEAG